jgi:ABC-type glycerol-3-phosphate transport system permease component
LRQIAAMNKPNAARVDGCSEARLFFQIVLPLATGVALILLAKPIKKWMVGVK